MAKSQDGVHYAHEGQRIFNEQLLQQQKPVHHDIVNAPWMSNEAMAQLPAIRREFDRNRDPMIAKQMSDLGKTESERREEQSGRGSEMVKKDRPMANLNPPKEIAAPMDAEKFRGRWLSEQRSAAMADHRPETGTDRQEQEVSRKHNSPQRDVF